MISSVNIETLVRLPWRVVPRRVVVQTQSEFPTTNTAYEVHVLGEKGQTFVSFTLPGLAPELVQHIVAAHNTTLEKRG